MKLPHPVDKYRTLSGFYQIIVTYEDVTLSYFGVMDQKRPALQVSDHQVNQARQVS
ncbi:hypothetical protein ACFQ22_06380 [Lentilactobacillus raoultii]|uniref:Uncharacterized protein n=1 Tax=Lentilactobacillus raoultii TaxID=1987503 RepID=A0ABW3PJ49_9LACO|nr:hypothetical protein [Lentilactobacillus raoultii]